MKLRRAKRILEEAKFFAKRVDEAERVVAEAEKPAAPPEEIEDPENQLPEVP